MAQPPSPTSSQHDYANEKERGLGLKESDHDVQVNEAGADVMNLNDGVNRETGPMAKVCPDLQVLYYVGVGCRCLSGVGWAFSLLTYLVALASGVMAVSTHTVQPFTLIMAISYTSITGTSSVWK